MQASYQTENMPVQYTRGKVLHSPVSKRTLQDKCGFSQMKETKIPEKGQGLPNYHKRIAGPY